MKTEEYFKEIFENIIFHTKQLDGRFITDEADFYITRPLDDNEDPSNNENIVITYNNDRYEVLHILTLIEISTILETLERAYIQLPSLDDE